MVELPQQLVPASTVTEVSAVPPLAIASLPSLGVEVSGTITVEEIAPSGRRRLYGPAHPEFSGSPAPSPFSDLIYTVQESPPERVEVQQVIACNTTAAAATFTLTLGAVATGVAFFFERSVAANDTEIFDVIIPLTAGEELHAQQQTADAIALTVIGEVNNA